MLYLTTKEILEISRLVCHRSGDWALNLAWKMPAVMRAIDISEGETEQAEKATLIVWAFASTLDTDKSIDLLNEGLHKLTEALEIATSTSLKLKLLWALANI